MRLHHLEITAFGPYAGTERIDMDALTSSGLFLLEVPTGAGKSTILDAITFALYGRTSGGTSSDDRLRSHFAAPGVAPRVVLDLSVGGERLRITRSPQHERPKKSGTGTTTEAMSVHLQREEAGSWVSLSSNKREVGEMLTERIGLSADQFTQVVLLPQGEFATFLKADDDARRAVLTTIFGTRLYDRITSDLDGLSREAGRERDQAGRTVDTVLAAAAQAAGLTGEERIGLGSLPVCERPAALDTVAQTLADSLADACHRRGTAATDLVAAEAAHVLARDAAELHLELADALRLQAEHEETRTDHERRAEELRLAAAAASVGILLAQLADAEADVVAAREAVAGADSDLDGSIVDGSDAPERARLGLADERRAAELGPLVDREVRLVATRGEIADLTADLETLRIELVALEQESTALPGRIAAADIARSDTATLAATLGTAAEAEVEIDQRLHAAADLESLAPQLEKARADHASAVARHQQLREEHLTLWERHLEGIASTLAGELADGAACRVCGSVEHPDPAQPAPDAVSSADVTAARVLAEAAEADEQRLAVAFHDLDRHGAELLGRIGDSDLATLRLASTSAAAAVAAARAAVGELPDLVAAHAILTSRQRELGTEITIARGSEATLVQKLAGLTSTVEEEERAVAAGRGRHATVAAHRRALLHSAARHRAAADSLAALRRALDARDLLLRRAEVEARAQGFDDLATARAARRSTAQHAALEAAVERWSTTAIARAAAATDSRFRGLDPADAAPAQQRLAEAALTVGAAREAHDSALTEESAARDRVEAFARGRAELAAAEQQRERVLADTEAVLRLAGLAKGTTSAMKMSLTTYVLRRWFEQVVAAANLRLRTMSSGRYELERVDEAESARQRAGLTLKVVDRHTGESRSPKSLSGGETFYTSLALALGLADVVRAEAGGVELDTLFIDEGFGTLDSETLDQVMTVIDELRNGGRVVGIVSHGADLKEQISERLEIRRRADGSSFTTVVA